MNRKLNKLSLIMILLGIMFILTGLFFISMDRITYRTKQNAVNEYKQKTKENTFTIQIQNQRKANVKVLGYKPNSNTKETILEAYGSVKVKQNNRNELEIILDTESGE